MPNPTWNEFERARGPAAPSPDATRYAELCAAVFSSGSGAELMKLMRARTIERRTGRGAPDVILREEEAVRSFVADLETARDRGLETIAKAKSAAR